MIGPPTSWWSSPTPAKPRTSVASVMATAAASVSASTMPQTACALSRVEALAQVRDRRVGDLEDHVRLQRAHVVRPGHEPREHERERDSDDADEAGDLNPARDVLGSQAPDRDDREHHERADEHDVDEGDPVVHALAFSRRRPRWRSRTRRSPLRAPPRRTAVARRRSPPACTARSSPRPALSAHCATSKTSALPSPVRRAARATPSRPSVAAPLLTVARV